MKVRKILIVPSYKLVEEVKEPLYISFFIRPIKSLARRFGIRRLVYNDEVLFHGDVVKVLGNENVFVFGKHHHHLHEVMIPDNCRYPSCHGTPRHIYLKENEVRRVIKDDVDAVLVSIRAGARGDLVIHEARKCDIPVAMIDTVDHESNYGADDMWKELCYGFKPRKHFDLYFKKDLPLGYKTDAILPLGPIPVRPESHQFPNSEKDVDIFFSGRLRTGRTQADRAETVLLVRDNFPGAVVLEHDSSGAFISTRRYWDYLSRSKMALSPSGRIWDSFRHCEIGLAPRTALIAPKPYIETVGPFLRDGVNAILYDTEFRDGQYHLVNGVELGEKIAYYLANSRELERIAEAWTADVLSGHTIFARSKHIIESIERGL